MRDIKKLIIHCSATRKNQDIGVVDIARWHQEKGYETCGYHYVIRRDGSLEAGRPEDKQGAHCESQNKDSIGICLVGGLADDLKTPELNYSSKQWDCLSVLVDSLCKKYPDVMVAGHNDFTDKKTCPNFKVSDWMRQRNGSK